MFLATHVKGSDIVKWVAGLALNAVGSTTLDTEPRWRLLNDSDCYQGLVRLPSPHTSSAAGAQGSKARHYFHARRPGACHGLLQRPAACHT